MVMGTSMSMSMGIPVIYISIYISHLLIYSITIYHLSTTRLPWWDIKKGKLAFGGGVWVPVSVSVGGLAGAPGGGCGIGWEEGNGSICIFMGGGVGGVLLLEGVCVDFWGGGN